MALMLVFMPSMGSKGLLKSKHTAKTPACTMVYWECSNDPLTPIRLQKHRDTNGRRIVIQIGGVYTTFWQEEEKLLQEYRDRNGRCIAILFKKYRGVDSTPPSACMCVYIYAQRQSPPKELETGETLANHKQGQPNEGFHFRGPPPESQASCTTVG